MFTGSARKFAGYYGAKDSPCENEKPEIKYQLWNKEQYKRTYFNFPQYQRSSFWQLWLYSNIKHNIAVFAGTKVYWEFACQQTFLGSKSSPKKYLTY